MATDNEQKTLDYGAFIADLEAKRAALDQAIVLLRSLMAGGALTGNSRVPLADLMNVRNTEIHGGEVPAGAFHGKSIPEAAKVYLSLVKQKKSTREIAEALFKGGMESNSKNFETTVAGGLYRAFKTSGEIVRVKGGWGLAEWWPAGVRAMQDKGKAHKPKKARKQKPAKPAAVAISPTEKKPQERVMEFLRTNPFKVCTPREVSQALGIKVHIAALMLGKLAANKSIEKVESGKYRAAA